MSSATKHVVIIGGGFGGINAAKGLANRKTVRITIIDRRNHHLFQPLLYQVAMAALSPAEIAYPIRSLVRKYRNIDVLLDEAKTINLETKEVILEKSRLAFDYLIMACGSNHSYFGNNSWEQFAPGLKTLAQATEIRRRVLLSFEKAANENDIELQRQLLTFVIIGGGPTGVELAGSIAEMSRQSLRRDFKNLDTSRTRVILLEGSGRILGAYTKNLSYRAAVALEKLGVQVWTNAMVTKIDKKGVYIGSDEFVKTSTVLWAAGVAASPLNKKLGVPLDRSGRVIVTDNCNLEAHPEVFVIGDQASFAAKNGTLPGLAPVAIQQGKYVARQVLAMAKGKKGAPFRYIDKGQMATIGRNKAVMKAFGIELSGLLAWFAWLFIHILYLIGFKNRLFVLLQWSWSYWNFKKGARLIIDKEWRSFTAEKSMKIDDR